jgi:predicted ATPase
MKSQNLPIAPTPFVGRAKDIEAITTSLANPACRLLTLVGPGGIGKTRLAIEAARTQSDLLNEDVVFIALQPLSSPDLILPTLAEALPSQFNSSRGLKEQILDYFRDQSMLLVFDNFEHLLAGVNLISELLQHAPNIKFIVTSRERLQLQNEVVFRLEGFSFSDWATPQTAAESSVVRLFLQSARLVNPPFELTHDMLGDLSSICRLVGGMPLGILLAASWLDTLSIAEIAQEIQRSFEFLEGNWRDLPERQRSLRAVFEQSWNLLNDEERFAMCCFSIFRGGFTREAAQQIANTSLKTLNSLVNKSLLIRDSSGRFDVHELLRQYSASELDHLYNERQQVQTRYAAYYARFMDETVVEIRRGQDVRGAVAQHAPDLVVLDMQIANMGGIACAIDLRLEAN